MASWVDMPVTEGSVWLAGPLDTVSTTESPLRNVVSTSGACRITVPADTVG